MHWDIQEAIILVLINTLTQLIDHHQHCSLIRPWISCVWRLGLDTAISMAVEANPGMAWPQVSQAWAAFGDADVIVACRFLSCLFAPCCWAQVVSWVSSPVRIARCHRWQSWASCPPRWPGWYGRLWGLICRHPYNEVGANQFVLFLMDSSAYRMSFGIQPSSMQQTWPNQHRENM